MQAHAENRSQVMLLLDELSLARTGYVGCDRNVTVGE